MSGPEQRSARPTLKPPGSFQPVTAPVAIELISPKIRVQHRDRVALVYIRQSTQQQVLDHRESLARQYALADYACALGWPAERVLTIDEDLGRSGTNAQRSGFQRLLSEVSLGHVGLILGLEMSRLSRSNKDWAQLIEVCALFDTLLGDQDGIYDPNDINDRMLLGLKGTISEVELSMMRNRLERGRQNKAARGEVFQKVPIGYVKLPNGQVGLDPDEQVRAVVALVFAKYAELGTVPRVFHYLIREHIDLGIRCHEGPKRGQLEWRRPRSITLYHMLHHPMYAGAYVWGRYRRQRRRLAASGASFTEVKTVPPSQWKVLLRDRLPAYITWEQYQANQECLRQHRSAPDAVGAVRSGCGLLPGLIFCGRCGGSLQIHYRNSLTPYYSCIRHLRDPTHPRCPGVSGQAVETLVTEQVLQALQPAAVELSLKAFRDIEGERARLDRLWQQRLKRCIYELQRAERQYQAVEPENRLVARTLEQRWEEALQQQRTLQEEYDRFRQQQPARLTEQEQERIRILASDIPALWHAPQTTVAQRKEIIRCVVERVVVTIGDDPLTMLVTIHWKGGRTSTQQATRPLKSYQQLPYLKELLDRVVYWRSRGCTAAVIADKLSEEGFRPPRRRLNFHAEIVRALLHLRGLGAEHMQPGFLGKDEWRSADLGRALGIDHKQMNAWVQRGWVQARRTPIHKRWIIWANAAELRRLRKLAAQIKSAPSHRPTDRRLLKPINGRRGEKTVNKRIRTDKMHVRPT